MSPCLGEERWPQSRQLEVGIHCVKMSCFCQARLNSYAISTACFFFLYHATSDAENCLSVIFPEGAGYLTTAEKQAMDEMREKECKLLQLYKVPIFVCTLRQYLSILRSYTSCLVVECSLLIDGNIPHPLTYVTDMIAQKKPV